MPKFHWFFNPLRSAGVDGGAATPPAAAAVPPTGEQPPATPAPGTPPAEGGEEPKAPEGNGSLIPGEEGAAGEGGETPPPSEAEEALKVEDLKLPEGMTAEDPALKGLLDALGNKDLKPTERAQALLDAYKGQVPAIVSATQAKMAADYKTINDGWIAEVKSDPVLSKPETMGVVAKALDSFGNGPELRKVFALTGAGNNPHVIRLIHTMASQLAEGRPAQGGASAPTKSAADLFYPSTPSN